MHLLRGPRRQSRRTRLRLGSNAATACMGPFYSDAKTGAQARPITPTVNDVPHARNPLYISITSNLDGLSFENIERRCCRFLGDQHAGCCVTNKRRHERSKPLHKDIQGLRITTKLFLKTFEVWPKYILDTPLCKERSSKAYMILK